MPFFNEFCQEHEFLFVILRMIVIILLAHILVLLRVDWTIFVTFVRGLFSFKIIVIDTDCTEMSFHEAVKGHIIRCFYGISPLCRCGKIRVRNLPHILLHPMVAYTITKHRRLMTFN